MCKTAFITSFNVFKYCMNEITVIFPNIANWVNCSMTVTTIYSLLLGHLGILNRAMQKWEMQAGPELCLVDVFKDDCTLNFKRLNI